MSRSAPKFRAGTDKPVAEGEVVAVERLDTDDTRGVVRTLNSYESAPDRAVVTTPDGEVNVRRERCTVLSGPVCQIVREKLEEDDV